MPHRTLRKVVRIAGHTERRVECERSGVHHRSRYSEAITMPFPKLELERMLAAEHVNDTCEPPVEAEPLAASPSSPALPVSPAPSSPPSSSPAPCAVLLPPPPSSPPPPIVDETPVDEEPVVYTAPRPFVPVAGIPETVRSIVPSSVKAARAARIARQEARLERARTRSVVLGIWLTAVLLMSALAYFVMSQ